MNDGDVFLKYSYYHHQHPNTSFMIDDLHHPLVFLGIISFVGFMRTMPHLIMCIWHYGLRTLLASWFELLILYLKQLFSIPTIYIHPPPCNSFTTDIKSLAIFWLWPNRSLALSIYIFKGMTANFFYSVFSC